MNYYSIYCVFDILPSAHLECWRHFILASRILCKRKLTTDDIKLADALLLRFCRRFELLYGQDSVTPNIHLHAHLCECFYDYGPMSSFWLFSFERFNGILGDEPTNNRSIEVQLLNRFVRDNGNLQLLSSVPKASSDLTSTFSHAVIDHAVGFTSVKHLDSISDQAVESVILPANKYTICSLNELEMEILTCVYQHVHPGIVANDVYLPCSYQKMASVTIRGQKVTAGQYVLAQGVFPFTSLNSVRPAKIDYFFKHSVLLTETETISHFFAIVNWPMQHPLQHDIGKPYEIWCKSAYENCDNCILPLDNISTILLTACLNVSNENVLVTVPLII